MINYRKWQNLTFMQMKIALLYDVSGITIEEVYRKNQDQLQVAFLNW